MIDIGDMFSTSMEMPNRIRNISTAVLGLEKSRASMKRSIERSRIESRYVQYSILSAVFAGNMLVHDNQSAFVLLSLLSLDLVIRASRKNQ